jgi:hypothetical protein
MSKKKKLIKLNHYQSIQLTNSLISMTVSNEISSK